MDGPVLRCHGCGAEVAAAPYPFRCPRADSGDDADHVLEPLLDPNAGPFADATATQPFVRYRAGLYSYALARARGMSDHDFVRLVHELDAAVGAVAGHGFRPAPLTAPRALATRLARGERRIWVKDFSDDVAGSHKARHLFGIALALEVAERTGLTSRAESDRRGLVIASCGNAALAASVIAGATRRPLRVFVPAEANPAVVGEIGRLGGTIRICARTPGVDGDPCLAAFRQAVREGALSFCCQGSDNGLTLEGGMTSAWEMAEVLAWGSVALDRLFIQVGGGALASAIAQGFERAQAAGLTRSVPRLHAVQTEGAWPLRRAYRRLSACLLGETDGSDPTRAAELLAMGRAAIEGALDGARRRRSQFMWPWESVPRSIAGGILDDETYDWFQVVRAMIQHGGWPVVVPEARLVEAQRVAEEVWRRPADATGCAGLAGLLELDARGELGRDECTGVLITGAARR